MVRTQENTIDICLSSAEMKTYLLEALDEQSAALIDEHLADCELCCDALEALSTDDNEGLGLDEMDEALNLFQEQVANEPVEVTYEMGDEAPIKKLRFTHFWKVAAAVLLLVSVFWFWQHNWAISGESLFISYYEPYEDMVSTRSGEGFIENQMAAAMELYNASAFEQAAIEFDKVLKAGEDNDLGKLYLAVCYLSLSREKEANAQLLQVVEANGALTDVAHWYLGLSYLKLEDKEASRIHLNKVVDEQGVFKKEAQEVLEKLD